jgi:probable rRNA maturation factor
VWLARIAPRSARGIVTVAVVSDARVKALNRKYRKTNSATDVLSFPGDLFPGKGSGAISARGHRKLHHTLFLGDIVIARGIARKQAKFLGHSVSCEIRVLALHGLLHLLGYDHDSDDGRMARVEARLRRKAGLPPGLIARSS